MLCYDSWLIIAQFTRRKSLFSLSLVCRIASAAVVDRITKISTADFPKVDLHALTRLRNLRSLHTTIAVDVKQLKLTTLILDLPVSTQELDLSDMQLEKFTIYGGMIVSLPRTLVSLSMTSNETRIDLHTYTNLTSVKLSSTKNVTGYAMSQLQHLDLGRGYKITQDELTLMTRLQSLYIRGGEVTSIPSGVSSLLISGCEVNNLDNLTRLETLTLLLDHNIRKLPDTIQTLSLGVCNVDNLENLTQLRDLSIMSSVGHMPGIQPVAGQLTRLENYHHSVNIHGCTNLRELTLIGTGECDDESLAHIHTLYVGLDSKISCEQLMSMTNLTNLSLRKGIPIDTLTNLTELDIAGSYNDLTMLVKLKTLIIAGSDISEMVLPLSIKRVYGEADFVLQRNEYDVRAIVCI